VTVFVAHVALLFSIGIGEALQRLANSFMPNDG
jgi:hypothetical protein